MKDNDKNKDQKPDDFDRPEDENVDSEFKKLISASGG